jgi:carboxylate-amine ligase
MEDRAGRSVALGAPTVGVEEEFFLLDPRTGSVAPVAPEVIALAAAPHVVTSEIMQYMVETRTPVCRTLDEVRTGLVEARRRVAEAASARDVVSVAVGVPPRGLPREVAVTETPRYAELVGRFPHAARSSATCSCHVHVGVADRRIGLQVLLRLRPWLPVLLALTAASPVWEGRDSGWASRRFPHNAGWATSRPPPDVCSVEAYDAGVRAAISTGLALDERSVYYLARLSPRYPTIEVRVADVCLTTDHAVAYAGLVRALVATAVDEVARGVPLQHVPDAVLLESCWSAARVGLAGRLCDPRTGERRPTRAVVEGLLDRVRPTLDAWGDEVVVVPTIEQLVDVGGGAALHRQLLGSVGTPAAYAQALSELTAGLQHHDR